MARSKIRWKENARVNCIEGFIKDVESFNIEGAIYLFDIRHDGIFKNWDYPRKYKISSIEEAKKIANDLIEGKNVELHEKNRTDLEKKSDDEGKAFVKLMHDADELLRKIRNRHNIHD